MKISKYLTAAVACCAMTVFGQPTQSAVTSGVAPDFTGIWVRLPIPPSPGAPNLGRGPGIPDGGGKISLDQFGFNNAELPPLTPWGQERYNAWQKGSGSPEWYPYCLPGGFPRDYTEPYLFQVVQTPSIMVMIFEWQHGVRQIYLDGRKHQESPPLTFMGDSIGRWEDDALVVDTTHIETPGFMDSYGNPHSDALHIVERMTRPDHNTLKIDFTFDDPIAYTKPWTGKKMFRLVAANSYFGEVIPCEDHFKDTYDKDLKSGKMHGIP